MNTKIEEETDRTEEVIIGKYAGLFDNGQLIKRYEIPPYDPLDALEECMDWVRENEKTKGQYDYHLSCDRVITEYYPDGKPKRCITDNKDLNETKSVVEWWENGQVKTKGTLNKDFEWIGQYESWHDNGRLEEKGLYSNDGRKIGGLRTWYRDGQLRSRADYGVGDGPFFEEMWHENGQMAERGTYKEELRTMDGFYLEEKDRGYGLVEKWHDNGQPAAYEPNREGKKHGKFKWWDRNGEILRREEYIEDKAVGVCELMGDDGIPCFIEIRREGEKWDVAYVCWHGNGQLDSFGYCKNDEDVGIYMRFHENGQLEHFIDYDKGINKMWDENGNPIENEEDKKEEAKDEFQEYTEKAPMFKKVQRKIPHISLLEEKNETDEANS